jgi:hypothetical protein
MAIAEGVSKMRTVKPLSLHTQTMLVLLPMYRSDLKIDCVEEETSIVISVSGLAIKNEF